MAKRSLSKICTFPNCTNPFMAQGYCQKHYKRFKKYGDPTIRIKMRANSLREMFEHFLPAERDVSACWEWQGTRNSNDYGVVHFKFKNYGAHRVSLFLKDGVWPENALHHCDNRICVNPNHLYDGTIKENVQDALDRERHPIGERGGGALLRNTDIEPLWLMIWAGKGNTEIAEHFPVTRDTISLIRHGKEWKQISNKVFEKYGRPIGSEAPAHRRGSDQWQAKLTESQVREIRQRIMNNETDTQIALFYGVTRKAISAIRTGRNWKHVT